MGLGGLVIVLAIDEGMVSMGEAAEMVLEGLLCEVCGAYVDGEEPGYPRKCENCEVKEELL